MAHRLDDATEARNHAIEQSTDRDESREPRRFRNDFRRLFAGQRPQKASTELALLRSLSVGRRQAGQS
jgi:hypothetical protein